MPNFFKALFRFFRKRFARNSSWVIKVSRKYIRWHGPDGEEGRIARKEISTIFIDTEVLNSGEMQRTWILSKGLNEPRHQIPMGAEGEATMVEAFRQIPDFIEETVLQARMETRMNLFICRDIFDKPYGQQHFWIPDPSLSDKPLRKYWFSSPTNHGVGITAFSLDDAYKILAEAKLFYDLDVEITGVREGIADYNLHQEQIQPHMTRTKYRGVWFPMLGERVESRE